MSSFSNNSHSMLLDGLIGAETVDSSGEVLDVEGADLSSFETEDGIPFNWEHKPGEDGPDTIVGKLVYYKKLYDRKDCENDRQEMYWDQVKVPCIYAIMRLFDGAGHEKAKAIAAIARDCHANNEPLLVRYSVEGSTLERDGNVLKSTAIRRVAITIKPCNKGAHSGLLQDPNAPDGFDKKPGDVPKDFLEDIIDKTEVVDPRFVKLSRCETYINPFLLEKIEDHPNAPYMHLTRKLLGKKKDLFPKVDKSGVEAQPITINFPIKHLPGIASKGKYLNQHQTKRSSSGDYDPSGMADIEEKVMGIPQNVPGEQRPVYGSLWRKDSPHGGAPYYGDCWLELHPHVKQRSTFTSRDSWDSPNGLYDSTDYHHAEAIRQVLSRAKRIGPNTNYVEAQIHGGVDVPRDVKAIYIKGSADKIDPKHLKAARALKKPIYFVDNKGQQTLAKTMTAGGVGGAPSTLTGGAALAKEDDALHKGAIKAQILAALRDYGNKKLNKEEFRAFMKNRLPDVSDEFLDHFTDAADDFSVKLRKAEEGGISINPKTGDLQTPLGVLKPQKFDDKFQALMEHPKHSQVRDQVMMNWLQLHDLHKKGQVPEEVKMHAALVNAHDPRMLQVINGASHLLPDTHFLKDTYGLDDHSADYVKGLLSDPRNKQVLNGMDEWYLNHPASQYMLTKSKWAQSFKEDPHSAIFPAQWSHWNTIQHNDHGKHWDAIDPFAELLKSEVSLPEKTAELHNQYVKDYGEIPALGLYCKHLLPRLLEAAEHREKHGDLHSLFKSAKLENLGITLLDNLMKSLGEIKKPEVTKVDVVNGNKTHPAGRFMVVNGRLYHLEDYHGLLSKLLPEAPIGSVEAISRLHGLKMSPHVRLSDDPAPEVALKPDSSEKQATPEQQPQAIVIPQKKPSVFEYMRPGFDKPHTIEVNNGTYLMDGNKLSQPEVHVILSNAKKGLATIRYPGSNPQPIRKMEDVLRLIKAEINDPDDALAAVREAIKGGYLHPDVEKVLTQHIFEDRMTPGIGNKFAYERFRAKNKPGVYMSLDGNDFKSINDVFGHETGDHAIKTFGNTLRQTIDEAVPGVAKAFRNGGDEFVVHVPSMEHASRLARHLRTKMEQLPPINGVHQPSMSIGMGLDHDSADAALYEAKKQKVNQLGKRNWPIGKVPTLAHSNIPGASGPIPLDDHDHETVMSQITPKVANG